MNRIVRRMPLEKPLPKMTRVAAYARVSSAKDAMHHSLSAQISYYTDLICRNPGWVCAGVFADEAVTGTRDTREGFQQLLSACREGRVDAVITKSISRFARNTVTLLETVRELKALGIDVFFEEQNVHTLSADGELILTILASYAQEESRSVSENMKWRVRKNFKEGKPWNGTMYGYRLHGGVLAVEQQEAEVVRRIFREYLGGKGMEAIAKELNGEGVPTRFGRKWRKESVFSILHNYAYTGSLLLQTTFRDDHLTKRKCVNDGQLPRYHAENTHEAIVSREEYESVQAEIARRAEKHAPRGKDYRGRYPFSGLIVCGCCGKRYRRKITATGPVWICSTFNSQGKAACPSRQIPEQVLMDLTADMDIGELTEIRAEAENRLVFRFKDGRETVKHWQPRSRADSWTPEMREAARQREDELLREERAVRSGVVLRKRNNKE